MRYTTIMKSEYHMIIQIGKYIFALRITSLENELTVG